jgi:hypothetical protein
VPETLTGGQDTPGEDGGSASDEESLKGIVDNDATPDKLVFTKSYIDEYRPKVVNRQWYISETDLDWISIGCYILGTGGGGSPYQHMLRLREMLRAGATVRVVSPWDLNDKDIVACGGGKGSPQVSIEKPYGDE